METADCDVLSISCAFRDAMDSCSSCICLFKSSASSNALCAAILFRSASRNNLSNSRLFAFVEVDDATDAAERYTDDGGVGGLADSGITGV